jgi:hypothetical protein
MAGEITRFDVSPAHFSLGEPLSLELTFANTGDLAASGKAVVQVRDAAGVLLDERTYDMVRLAAGQTAEFTGLWATAGRAPGRYYFTANVFFDGESAGPAQATASTDLYAYLPLIMKRP